MTAGAQNQEKPGPLAGLRIIEMAGLGPVPLAGLMLSELGANVIRIERKGNGDRPFLAVPPDYDLDRHGRDVVKVDLKRPQGIALMFELIGKADILVEGFRPGVMERLGLGPAESLARNPRLIYGRMTGFGQDGPLADRAGHDLTYLAYSGILHAIGPKDGRPVPPLNLAADFGGGTMFLIMGVLAALFERQRSGRGQVIDAAMIDGVSMLASPFFAFMATGFWQDRRGSNLLDSGAPFYDTYETADGGHVAVACLEPQFFAEFARLLPLDEKYAALQYDRTQWDGMRAAIATRIGQKTRDEWAEIFGSTDACVAPVLSMREAPDHPHNRSRQTHQMAGTLKRPAPAPRFSRTPAEIAGPSERTPHMLSTALQRFGMDAGAISALADAGVIGE
ncbi:alpha-methylacyl-CoA racemase [Mesorhizobium albiziae]|uniref:Alpha-methylacyl-CoA racemase n=1 Tax=Neomesorhizobium albiziae TaxID=335020 RepID=A0A1I4DYC2_9HYPH|nr:CaiB/BaiF CoA-transferase family protein [Mesorhizobium albiziae]GLS31177.1 CoA transferase [Mesorhizobium albiziae]SFK98592.1 alpha-methylacyl-CoA racemase [Mesorhizobium albiziae]